MRLLGLREDERRVAGRPWAPGASWPRRVRARRSRPEPGCRAARRPAAPRAGSTLRAPAGSARGRSSRRATTSRRRCRRRWQPAGARRPSCAARGCATAWSAGAGARRTGLVEVQEALDLHELDVDRLCKGRDAHADIHAGVIADLHLVGQRAEVGLCFGALSRQPIARLARVTPPDPSGSLPAACRHAPRVPGRARRSGVAGADDFPARCEVALVGLAPADVVLRQRRRAHPDPLGAGRPRTGDERRRTAWHPRSHRPPWSSPRGRTRASGAPATARASSRTRSRSRSCCATPAARRSSSRRACCTTSSRMPT